MSASRHTYAVVVKAVDSDLCSGCTVLLFDIAQQSGYAVYGSRKAAESYRAGIKREYPDVNYEVVQLR